MNIKILALLFCTASTLALEMTITVEFDKASCFVSVGKMRYKKPLPIAELATMGRVTLFYVHGQETFWGSKTLGKSFYGLKAGERVPLNELNLVFSKGDANLRRFQGKFQMSYVTPETEKDLQVKTIYKSQEEVVLYVGESKYYQLFLLKDQGEGWAELSFGEQSSMVTMADFHQFRSKTQKPEVSEVNSERSQLAKALLSPSYEMQFRLIKGFKGVTRTYSALEMSQFGWINNKSGFVVVAIGSSDVKGIRIFGLHSPKTELVCEIYAANPFYTLQSVPPLNDVGGHSLISMAQEVFVEAFVCHDLALAETLTISRSLRKDEQGNSDSMLEEREGKNTPYLGATKLSKNELLEIESNQLPDHVPKGQLDLSFDFAALLGRYDKNIDVRLTREVNNRAVFFRVGTDKDSTYLKLYTLDPKHKVVTRRFDLGEKIPPRIRLWYVSTSKSKAQKVALDLVRKIRMHTNMFDGEDYCHFLSATPLVQREFIFTPADMETDIGYIHRLTDEKSELDMWQSYSYLSTSPIKNSDKTVEYLNLVMYNPYSSAVMTLEDTHTIGLATPSLTVEPKDGWKSHRLMASRMVQHRLTRVSDQPFPVLDALTGFSPTIQIISGKEVKSAPAVILEQNSAKVVLFHVRPEQERTLNSDLEVVFKHLQATSLYAVFYSTLKNARIMIDNGKISLTLRHKTVSFDSTLGFGFDGTVRVVYKKLDSCTVLTKLGFGLTLDYPDQHMSFVDVDGLKIELGLTQFYQSIPNEVLIVLMPHNDLPLTDDQYKALVWGNNGEACHIPTESVLSFEISEGAFSLLDRTRAIRYVAPAPRIVKSEAATFQNGNRPRMALQKKVLEGVQFEDGSAPTVLGGSVVDLDDNLQKSFFSAKANSFTYPTILLGQKDAHVYLDFVQASGKLRVEVKANKVVLVVSESQSLDFHLSSPSVAVQDSQTRYFTLKLQLLVDKLEAVEATKQFPETDGLNLEAFETNSFDHSFEIEANVAPQALEALVQRLTKASPKLAFAAHVFQTEAREATIVVYDQSRFVHSKVVDGGLIGEFDDDKLQKVGAKMPAFAKKELNPKFFKNAPGSFQVDQDMNIIVAKPQRQQVSFVSRNQVFAFGNSVCNSQKCIPAAVYPELGGATFHLLTKRGDIEAVGAQGAALSISATNSLRRIPGQPVHNTYPIFRALI